MSQLELKERLAHIVLSITKYSGLLSGLAAVGYADPASLQSLLLGIGANFITQILIPQSPPPPTEKVMAELDHEEIIQGLCRALTEKGLDRQVIAALGQLPPEQAEPVWLAYTADTGRLKDTTVRTSPAYGSLREILTRPRFMVAIMPSHLNRLLGGFMPHQLVERPELEPLTRALFDGRLRQAAILARPLTGKSILAVQAAMKWLNEPNQGRAVAYLGYAPSAEDAAPLNALDPEKHLVIIDPVSPEPLEDKETANIIGLACRTILCQRIGQSQYQKQVKGLVSFLEAPGGGNYKRWNIAANDTPSPAWDRVYIHLGPMPKQTVFSMLFKSREVLDRQCKLTLENGGKEAIFEALQALSGRDETTLLGLAKALLLFAIQKAGQDRLTLDRPTVTNLLDEIGLSLTGPTAEEEWERIVENLFGGIITDEEKSVLLVMKHWRWFTQSAVLPLQALYAGYSCLTNDCDLRTKDFHLLERLEATRIITRDNEDETVRIWHPLQLEAIRDGFDYGPRYKWMQKSLNKLRELAFPPDALLVTKITRVGSLSQFCVDLLVARNRERVIADILRDSLEIYRGLTKGNPKAYLPYVAGTANNLGVLLTDLGERPEARSLYEEALEIRRRLAADNPKAYLPDVAMTANNLGLLLASLEERSEARSWSEVALEIYRRLAKENRRAYLPGVATTANNLGALLVSLGERAEARALFEEALEIRRRLAPENPKAYLPDVAMTANNLGLLLAGLEERPEARSLYEEALEIYRRLATEYPKAYLPYVAGTVFNFGIFYVDQKDYIAAAPFAAVAVTLHAALLSIAPLIFRPRLQTSLKLARILYQADEFRSERDSWLRALQVDLVRQIGPEGAEALTNFIIMTDEEFERLKNQLE